MKKFQIDTHIQPLEVLRRFSAIIDQNAFSSAGWRERFTGRLDGDEFWFRRERPYRRNSFAPVCAGKVTPKPGGGSVIDFSIGTKLTFFYIFAGIFVGLSAVFGIIFGLVTASAAFSFPAGEIPPAVRLLSLLPFLIPVGTILFFALMLTVGRWMGKSDEAAMIGVVRQIFVGTGAEIRAL